MAEQHRTSASRRCRRGQATMSWAFVAALGLIVVGHGVAYVVFRDPAKPPPPPPVGVVAGSVPAGFALEQFADRAAAERAEALDVQSGFTSLRQRLANTKATQGGKLEVALLWNATSDLDLWVMEPGGQAILWKQPRTAMGRIDVDANPMVENVQSFDGQVRPPVIPDGPETIFSRTPIEHIVFDNPVAGFYQVKVHCFGWREADRTPLPLVVEVRSGGDLVARVKGTIGPQSYTAERVMPTDLLRVEVK